MANCSNCGAGLGGQFCARCGADNEGTIGPPGQSALERAHLLRSSSSGQRHGVPALLSFFIPGLGQLVKGDLMTAALIFVAGIFGAVLCVAGAGFFVLPIVWIWNIYDAYVAPDGPTKRELKRLSNLAVILACALAIVGCGSVTADPHADGGTGGGGGKVGLETGAAGSGGGASSTGGAAGMETGGSGPATGGGGGTIVIGTGGGGGTIVITTGTGGDIGTGGSAPCGGANLQSDSANCGTCGHACAAGQTCATGTCHGYGDCQGRTDVSCLLEPSGDICTPGSPCAIQANGTGAFSDGSHCSCSFSNGGVTVDCAPGTLCGPG